MALWFLPSRCWVVFFVQTDHGSASFSVRPADLMHGLRAARQLIGFGELLRDEEALEELLPWSGNV